MLGQINEQAEYIKSVIMKQIFEQEAINNTAEKVTAEELAILEEHMNAVSPERDMESAMLALQKHALDNEENLRKGI